MHQLIEMPLDLNARTDTEGNPGHSRLAGTANAASCRPGIAFFLAGARGTLSFVDFGFAFGSANKNHPCIFLNR